mmetsp:Transcript_64218/g.165832  ORF Transcript_64218/g.165832 Transcript_64218/m.165832 type:complete len:270 (-) Transcript_64218:14-823(-)
MLYVEVFVLEILAVNALPSGAVAHGKVAPRADQAGHHPVKNGAQEVQALAARASALFPGAEAAEVLCSLRHTVREELHLYSARGLAVEGDFEEHLWIHDLALRCHLRARCLGRARRRRGDVQSALQGSKLFDKGSLRGRLRPLLLDREQRLSQGELLLHHEKCGDHRHAPRAPLHAVHQNAALRHALGDEKPALVQVLRQVCSAHVFDGQQQPHKGILFAALLQVNATVVAAARHHPAPARLGAGQDLDAELLGELRTHGQDMRNPQSQ